MKNYLILFALSLMVYFVQPLYAILDVDSDGMSDVWEQQYGFSSTKNANSNQAPAADPNGDGFSNQLESIAGTDPLNSTPPLGIYRISVTPNLMNPLSLDLQ
jgi:Bacterial TSP3 repeat